MLTHASLALAARNHEEDSSSTVVYKMKDSIQAFSAASNSVILSLAAFIVWKYPNLLPLKFKGRVPLDLSKPQKEPTYASQSLSLHPYFELWSDHICEAIFKGQAKRNLGTLYVAIEVSKDQFLDLEEDDWKIQTLQHFPNIKEIFQLPIEDRKEKKIGLLNLALSQLRTDLIQPKINVPALIVGSIFSNEIWVPYRILKGQIPSVEQLLEFDTIILPGSTNSILDTIPQITLLTDNLKEALVKKPSLRVLGICYGHQFISKLFGAKIERKKRYRGLEHIDFNNSIIQKFNFLQPLKQISEDITFLPEHHEDYVEDVPEGFHLLGTSESCEVQAMVSKNGRFLSYQFHPQYFSQYTISYSRRTDAYSGDHIRNFALQLDQSKIPSHHQSCESVRETIQLFINHHDELP